MAALILIHAEGIGLAALARHGTTGPDAALDSRDAANWNDLGPMAWNGHLLSAAGTDRHRQPLKIQIVDIMYSQCNNNSKELHYMENLAMQSWGESGGGDRAVRAGARRLRDRKPSMGQESRGNDQDI